MNYQINVMKKILKNCSKFYIFIFIILFFYFLLAFPKINDLSNINQVYISFINPLNNNCNRANFLINLYYLILHIYIYKLYLNYEKKSSIEYIILRCNTIRLLIYKIVVSAIYTCISLLLYHIFIFSFFKHYVRFSIKIYLYNYLFYILVFIVMAIINYRNKIIKC